MSNFGGRLVDVRFWHLPFLVPRDYVTNKQDSKTNVSNEVLINLKNCYFYFFSLFYCDLIPNNTFLFFSNAISKCKLNANLKIAGEEMNILKSILGDAQHWSLMLVYLSHSVILSVYQAYIKTLHLKQI